jgi:carboxypeptidase PM20D1
MRTLKRVLLVLAAMVLLLAAAVVANTLRQGSLQAQVPAAPALAVDTQRLAETLAGAVRLRTVSSQQDASLNADEFRKLHAWLEQRFPLVHAHLKREVVNGLSLLYTWPGTDPNARPIALMAHQDVVPIEPGTEAQWEQPPFSGAIRDGYVWGRGSWDDKGSLVAELEAIEMLLASGFQPRQTVYLISGADEEVTGLRGARQIAQLLEQRKVHLDFVIDEGLVITQGILPGVKAPVAIVGVAEKGYLSVLLKANAQAGHSAMPPPAGTGAIGRMGAALARLDREQLPAHIGGVAGEMLGTMAPEMHGLQRVALSNLWLFGPLVRAQLEKSPGTNATLRTTTALTMLRAGDKENVLPAQADAVVNFRIIPGETRETVLQHVRTIAGEGFAVQALPGSYDPTPVSSTASTSYRQVERTIRSLYPDTLVAPGLYIAGSDSRHLVPVADHIYRFLPVHATSRDLARLHGTNERISLADLAGLVRFYHQLLRNLNALPA